MKNFYYNELVKLGFERYDMNDRIAFDMYGFDDFFLFLKVSKDITFEWHWKNPEKVKMIRYKKHDIQNIIEIYTPERLDEMINFFTKTK